MHSLTCLVDVGASWNLIHKNIFQTYSLPWIYEWANTSLFSASKGTLKSLGHVRLHLQIEDPNTATIFTVVYKLAINGPLGTTIIKKHIFFMFPEKRKITFCVSTSVAVLQQENVSAHTVLKEKPEKVIEKTPYESEDSTKRLETVFKHLSCQERNVWTVIFKLCNGYEESIGFSAFQLCPKSFWPRVFGR